MPDGRGATVFDDLPEEVVVDKILTRLPPKDVGRCRAVSKSWRSSTSTPEFTLRHLRCQRWRPIIDGNKRPAGLVLLRAAASASQQLWPFGPCRKRCCSIHLEAACDGFLIVGGSRYYICNPTIRKHAPLPQPPRSGQGGHKAQNEIVGFYRHQPTGEYRVLWVSRTPSHSGILSEALLYVHTVGSHRPRHVTVRLPTLSSSPSEEVQLLLKRLPYGDSANSPPAHHRGSLHWIVERCTGDDGDIIVFDTEAESFRWMRTPALLTEDKKLVRSIKLFDMNGELGLSAICNEKLDVWVMQDYEAGVWAFRYQINLLTMLSAPPQPPDPSSPENVKENPLKFFYPYQTSPVDMVVLNRRELLIQYNSNRVLCCDVDGKFLGMVSIGKKQHRMELTRHRLRESIMPVPSSEMMQIREDEKFPFHTEHCLKVV